MLLHAGEGELGQGTDGRPGGAARQAAAARGLARGGQQARLAKRHSSCGCSPGPTGRTKGHGWGCGVHGPRGRGAGVWPKAGEDDEHDVHGGARRKFTGNLVFPNFGDRGSELRVASRETGRTSGKLASRGTPAYI